MQLKTGMYQESINTEVKGTLFLTHSNRINSLPSHSWSISVSHILKGQNFRAEVRRHMAFPSRRCAKYLQKEKLMKERNRNTISYFIFLCLSKAQQVTNLKWLRSKSAAMVAAFRMGWLECSIGTSPSLLQQAL